MSLVERVHECTRHDLTGRVGLQVEDEVWGQVEPRLAAALGAFPDVFTRTDTGLALRADLDQADSRTGAIGGVVDALYPLGLFGARRGELYPVARQLADPPVFALERGAVGAFGTPAFGVHVNGFVRTPVGPSLWVARRASSKPTFAGRLDHLVGGGQPVGISLFANLQKECAEEAGIAASLSATARHVHALRYRLTDRYGFHDDTMHVFDLELPAAITPRATDGEVAGFELWSISRVIDTLRTSQAFKTNVALVILDWLLRENLLADDPERGALEAAIRPLRAPIA